MVNGLDYAWSTSMIDPHFTLIKVWLDVSEEQAGPLLVRCRFEEPWQIIGPLQSASPTIQVRRFQPDPRVEAVTPGLIRQIVEAARLAGWQPEIDREGRHFEWVSGDLHPVDDATLPGEDPFGVLKTN